MSARRDKKRIDPSAPQDAPAAPAKGRRARKAAKADASAASIPAALAALTGDFVPDPVTAEVEATPEAVEIAALTTRHRTAALEPTRNQPIAPRMRAFRLPAILVVVALLAGAALIERGDADTTTTTVAAAPTDVSRLAPVASAPGAKSSTFYCAGGTALGSVEPAEPAPEGETGTTDTTGTTDSTDSTDTTVAADAPATPTAVVAEQSITIANLSDADQQATVTAVPSVGDPVVQTTTVPAQTRSTITLSDLVTAPYAAALVETNGGSVAVEHQVQGPTGRSVAPCASSASATWYFPAGTTRLGTRQIYSVFNPFPQQAVVDFSFMVEEDGGRQATRESDQLKGIVVPPGRVVAVDITDIVTVRNQVATTVATRSGLGRVVVDQLQVSDGRSDWPEDLSLTLGAPAPSPTWLFADSRPLGEGVDSSFVAFNPGTTDAELEIYVAIDGQTLAPAVEPFLVTVRAGQYAQVPIGTDNRIPVGFGGFVVAVSRNDVPVVVERVLKQSDQVGPAGVALTMGTPVVARDWLVPIGGLEGQTSMQVSIANPSVSEPVTLTVEAVGEGDAGALEAFDAVSLAPGARTVVDLSEAQGAASLMLRVSASGPVIVGQWFSFADPGTLSDTNAFPVAGTLAVPGGEVTDRGAAPDVVEPEPFDGSIPLPGSTAPGGSTPGTDLPPGTDVMVPEETTTTTAPVETTVPATDPATGAPVDPAAVTTTLAPG